MRAKRRLGQHFLSDPRILARIADAVGAGPEDTVLEIGPGLGALTEQLQQRAGRVIAIERDRDLIPELRRRVPNVLIVEGDALELDWHALVGGGAAGDEAAGGTAAGGSAAGGTAAGGTAAGGTAAGGTAAGGTAAGAVRHDAPAASSPAASSPAASPPAASSPAAPSPAAPSPAAPSPAASPPAAWLIAGNIPYNITSPLIDKALTPPRPARVVYLVQKEVAERVAAAPGTSDYGALTVGVQAVAAVERLFTVPAGAFSPPPKVDSAVLRLTPLARPLVADREIASFRRMVVGLFGFRRKQLLRGVRELTGWPAERAGAALSAAGIQPELRPEAVPPDGFVRLHHALVDAGWGKPVGL